MDVTQSRQARLHLVGRYPGWQKQPCPPSQMLVQGIQWLCRTGRKHVAVFRLLDRCGGSAGWLSAQAMYLKDVLG